MNQVYQIITDKIIDELKQGRIPWKKSWSCGNPTNLVSMKEYNGINRLLLGLSPYASPYWLTFKQAKKLGGNVRKGEKSSIAVFYTSYEKESPDKQPGETSSADKTIRVLRYYRVFNVEQCEGIDYPKTDVTRHNDILAACESVIAGYADSPDIQHGGSSAYYSITGDYVNLPPMDTFDGSEDYYSTAFHELIHSTGHTSRLDRFAEADKHAAFGSNDYSKEELVAEIGACFLSNNAGIDKQVFRNSAGYIQAWLSRLSSNPKWIVQAAGKAQKAADYVLGVSA